MSFATQGNVSVVKSVQTGSMTVASGTTSNTATITSVNTAKAVVLYGGYSQVSTAGTYGGTLVLTNATTLTGTIQASDGANHIVTFTVLEYQ